MRTVLIFLCLILAPAAGLQSANSFEAAKAVQSLQVDAEEPDCSDCKAEDCSACGCCHFLTALIPGASDLSTPPRRNFSAGPKPTALTPPRLLIFRPPRHSLLG